MKLVTFLTSANEQHIGALGNDETLIVDFTRTDPAPHFRDMLSLIDGGPKALDQARALRESAKAVVLPAAGQRLLAPVPEPRQMRDCLCFEKHLKQASASMRMRENPGTTVDPETMTLPAIWYKQPIYYKGNQIQRHRPGSRRAVAELQQTSGLRNGVLHFHREGRQEHQA